MSQVFQPKRLQGVRGERRGLQPEVERGAKDASPLHRRTDGRRTASLQLAEVQKRENAGIKTGTGNIV